MKAFISFMFFFTISVLVARAGGEASYFKLIDSLEVGSRASEVFIVDADDGFAYAICLGYDQNNNGVEDQGDTRPSLWKINYDSDIHSPGSVVKLSEFAFNSLILPVRYDKRKVSGNSYLLLPFINNVVCEIDLSTGEIAHNYHIDGAAVDAKYDGDYFRVCVLDEQDSPGKILRYNLATGIKVDALPGGVNLQESVVLNNVIIGSLSLGIVGTDDSDLWLRRVSESNVVSDSVSIHLGVNGSYLYSDETSLYATVYGSHKVMKIDLFNPFGQLDIDTLVTGTSGLEGPRQIYTLPVGAFITTYGGKLIIFENGSNTPDEIVEIPGKLEGICGIPSNYLLSIGAFGNLLFVASPYTNDFEPNNKIYLVESGITSVHESIASANFKLYAIPASETLNVEFTNEIVGASIEIRDLFGRSVKTLRAVGSHQNINVGDLAPGSYFAIISAEGKMWRAPFTVVR